MKYIVPKLIVVLITVAGMSSCAFEVRQAPTYVPNEKLEKIEGTKDDIDRATAAADKFHKLLNENNADELFDWIDPKSQLKQDPVAFHVRIGRILSELGTVVRSDLQRNGVFKKTGSLEVRLEYITRFSKDTDIRPRYELFYFELYPNGDTRLLDYRNGIDNEKGY